MPTARDLLLQNIFTFFISFILHNSNKDWQKDFSHLATTEIESQRDAEFSSRSKSFKITRSELGLPFPSSFQQRPGYSRTINSIIHWVSQRVGRRAGAVDSVIQIINSEHFFFVLIYLDNCFDFPFCSYIIYLI